MNKYIKNGVAFYTSSLLEKYKVPHAFTASRGGVSKGDFASLNISTRRKDSEGNTDKYENTVENYRRAFSLVGATAENCVSAHQVHGNTILELDESFRGMGIFKGLEKNIDGDGLYVKDADSGIEAICVKSADCTPILFADKHSGAVCAVHSGWRGTVLDIPSEAVRAMVKRGSRYEDILCCIGPCIGVCCYEVSKDVYDEAIKTLSDKNARTLADDLFLNRRETDNGIKYDFNIGKMCAELVRLSGVPKENIDFADMCTCCSFDSEGRIFFSHRGQKGHSGTFASVIAPFKIR